MEEIGDTVCDCIADEIEATERMSAAELQACFGVETKQEAIAAVLEHCFYETPCCSYRDYIDELVYRGVIADRPAELSIDTLKKAV